MKTLKLALLVAALGVLAVPAAYGQAAKKSGDKMAAKPANHTSLAITHTQMAIKEGQAGKADSLVIHAQEALTHAQAADKAKSTVHTQAAIKSLQEAVDHGKMGHADIATKAAQAALDHLKMK